MKRFYFLLGFFLLVKMASAQVLTEDFVYPAGQLITANGWTAYSGTTNAIAITSPGLTYAGHPGSGVGNAVSMTTTGEDDNKPIAPAINSGSVYFSFLVNLSAAQSAGDYFIGLFQTSSIFPVRVYAKLDAGGTGFYFGVSKGNSTVAYETTSRSFGTTYFVVANYIFNTGTTTDDVINLWVNPALGGTETTATIANVTGTSADAASIEAIYLRQGTAASAPTQKVDAILAGTTWASVTATGTPSPVLNATILSDFGNVTVGTNSTSQSFLVTGSDLTGAPGNITITAPSTDFEVSNDNSAWGSSTTIPFTSATLAGTSVYVRFTPQSAGLKTGDITISGGGTSLNLSVSGTGVSGGGAPAAPVATAATVVSGTSFTANWNAVTGATGYFLDVYTLTGGTVTETIAGWNFPINSAANQTADEGNANNLGIQTVTGNGVGTISWPSGPSGASGSPNPYSVSANGWDNGANAKYWQADVNTTGASNITVSSLQGASGTGPRDFKLQYKVGAAGTWTDVTGGTVTLTTAVVAGNLATWGAIADLPLPADANNQPLVSLRWIQTSNTSVNNATVASGGTSRISAIYIKGDAGGGSTPVYVTGYQNLPVGNVTSYNVTGLAINTTYYYVVRATNANGTSANSNEITVTTNSSVSPAISATALAAFGNVCTGSTAGPVSFTVNGTNLTTTDISVAALPGFTYSTTAGGTYTASLTITQPGGTFSQEVFVKFSPVAVQSYNGDIVVSGGGASSVNAAASGAGVSTVPSLTAGTASAITQVSATVAGTITDNGCTGVTAYGIEYSTTPGFANGSGTPVASTNLSGANFSSDLAGLSSATTYYYHAYATNSGGTGYSTELSFTTSNPNPNIVTTALTAFGNVCINTPSTPNSFTITGANLTNTDITVGPLAGYTFSTTAGGTYTSTLTLTQPGGPYTQQIFVELTPTAVQSYSGNIPVNGGGISAVVNVAASGSGVSTAPTVTTGAASAITTTTATLAGNITATGCSAVTAYGIEYSTTNGFANGTGTAVASSDLSGGGFSAAVSALVPATTYYYHAYATNSGGTAYGAQQSFTTATPVLTIITPLTAFGNVCINTTAGPNSFVISSTGLAAGNITVAALTGYTYSTTSGGTYTSTLTIPQAGGAFNQAIYVKFTPTAVQSYNGNISVSGGGAAAINVAVTGSGVNALPTIVTGAASNITTNSVVLEGTISAGGCSAASEAGFEYSGIDNFTPGTGTKVTATVNSAFSSAVTGLVQGATYYYRAYAKNAGSTAYGEQQSFTLATIPSGFVLYPVPVVTGQELKFSQADITPGYYGLQLISSTGQVVYQKDMNIQANFINQSLIIPAKLAKGVYQVRLVNNTGIVSKATILIL